MFTGSSDGVERGEERVVLERGRALSFHQGRQGLGLSNRLALEGGDEVFGLLRRFPLGIGQGEVDEGHLSLPVLGFRVVVHPGND